VVFAVLLLGPDLVPPVLGAFYLMFLGGYGGVLMLARVITLGDIRATWAAVTRAGHPAARSADGTERR
jgi:hypothetical protein